MIPVNRLEPNPLNPRRPVDLDGVPIIPGFCLVWKGGLYPPLPPTHRLPVAYLRAGESVCFYLPLQLATVHALVCTGSAAHSFARVQAVADAVPPQALRVVLTANPRSIRPIAKRVAP